MLLFKKKLAPGPQSYGPLPGELKTMTAELISIANRSESNTRDNVLVENTRAEEVIAARELIATQSELLRTIAAATYRGMSVAEIRRDIVEPAIENSVVGDLAWLMLCNVMDSAESKERGGNGRIAYQEVVNR